jgi:hypothetical protein
MTIAEVNQVDEVVRQVESWPVALRIELARRILETLADRSPPGPRGFSAEEVMAMFKPVVSPPSDEECERILEEELARKYGG